MYDLRAIRENPDWFDAALKRRGLDSLSSQVLEMDEARRSSQTKLGDLQARRNAASKEIGAAMKDKDTARADALKAEVAEIKDQMTALEEAEAIAEGKLRRLEGEGKPLPDRSSEAFIDMATAVAARIMAEAGALPEEFKIKKLLEAAKQSYSEAEGEDAKRVAMALIADLQQRYNIAVEARRRFMGS